MRPLAKLFLPVLAAIAILCSPAFFAPADARPLTGAEKDRLQQTVAAFDEAMRDEDYEKIADTIPPRVMEFIAKQAGLEVDALRAMVIQQMEATLATVEIEDFGMDMDTLKEAELANGAPYALIPTETVMTSEAAGTMRVQSETLALLDDDKWYLVRVDDLQQVAILRQVYPEFSAVEFSGGTVEASGR